MRREVPYWMRCALVAAVYFAVARIGFLAAVAQDVVSSAWPPSGFALAALLLLGPRLWPGVALGALAANLSAGVPLAGAAGIATGNTLEALTGFWLLRLAGFDAGLRRIRDVVALVFLGAMLPTALGAALGVTSLLLSGQAAAWQLPQLALVWWSGDALGVLVLTPFILAWSGLRRSSVWPRPPVEAMLLLSCVVVTTALLLSLKQSYVYMIFPAGMWAALRFGPRGATATTLTVATLTVLYTVGGLGPFSGSDRITGLLLLQVFLAMFAVSTLLLAAAVAESRRAEHRFRTLTELAPDLIFQASADGLITGANAEFAATLGWNRTDWIGRRVTDLLHPDDRAEFAVNFQRVVSGQESMVDLNRRLRHRDGGYVRVEGRALPLKELGRIVGVLAEVHDTTERQRAEDELRESRHRLRALSRRLIGVHEEERTRLSRELHDQIGQALSTVMMNLERLQRGGPDEEPDAPRLEDSIALVGEAVEQVRTLSFDLRPALLDDLGLAAAVTAYCRRQAERAGVALELDIEEPEAPLAPELETVCFRVMQEAVTNVLRHAKAGYLKVTLRDRAGRLELTVCDDGCGFDARPAAPVPVDAHLGIIGMTERAELVGGHVEVESQPGEGTIVRAVFPHHGSRIPGDTPTEPLQRVTV